MALYAISYDLKAPGRNYSDLYDAIKGLGANGNVLHVLESTWLVDTALSASQIWERLSPCIDKNDRVFISNIGNDRHGWLSKDAWAWIQAR